MLQQNNGFQTFKIIVWKQIPKYEINKSDVADQKMIGTCQKASVVRSKGLPLAKSERI